MSAAAAIERAKALANLYARDQWPLGGGLTYGDLRAVLAEIAALRARRDGLLDANNREVERRRRIVRAGRGLYLAGRWSCEELPAEDQARLWEELRDAIELAPGTATKAGVAAATNLCPYCADKVDCECEPPLPFLDRPGREL